ncbi:uncharacterized protein YxeA [Clostridium beijerinckii]|uniref:hypothetical protein n=1 Tax=Clostridium beijerinckii TaxID=1520 RepID=UPI001494856E|nr:hypothetical protein [Clostridium beijerinckii]NOW92351.1 uncharacterized protein YxeA [Clostridium beijerinckii]
MKDYIALITAVISIIIAIVACFNKEQEKGEELQEEYFKILIEYLEIKKVNPNIDVLEYIRKFKFKKCCIPGYMYYLADQNDKDRLEKLLLTDYWDYYPNIVNSTNKVLEKFNKLVYFTSKVSLILWGMFVLGVIFMEPIGLINNFSEINESNIFMIIVAALIIDSILILSFFLSKKQVDGFGNELDIYSMNIKTIQKTIRRKEKRYKKRAGKYYI